jgi:hypothetical protein
VASLYADEDVPFSVVVFLRARGHDVLTAFEAGQANRRIQDSEVLAHAASLGRIVLTHNRKDFEFCHRANPAHPGIISASRDDANTEALAIRIDAALAANPCLAGQHVRVNRSG